MKLTPVTLCELIRAREVMIRRVEEKPRRKGYERPEDYKVRCEREYYIRNTFLSAIEYQIKCMESDIEEGVYDYD